MKLIKAKDWIIANHTKTIAISKPDGQEYDMVSGTFDNIKSIIEEAQKNAIEVALKYAANIADWDLVQGDSQFEGIDPDDIIINKKSILNCKEDLFKLIDNE